MLSDEHELLVSSPPALSDAFPIMNAANAWRSDSRGFILCILKNPTSTCRSTLVRKRLFQFRSFTRKSILHINHNRHHPALEVNFFSPPSVLVGLGIPGKSKSICAAAWTDCLLSDRPAQCFHPCLCTHYHVDCPPVSTTCKLIQVASWFFPRLWRRAHFGYAFPIPRPTASQRSGT